MTYLKSRSRIGETITMLYLAARVERSLVLMPRYVNAPQPRAFDSNFTLQLKAFAAYSRRKNQIGPLLKF
jgi:hypothetical protein